MNKNKMLQDEFDRLLKDLNIKDDSQNEQSLLIMYEDTEIDTKSHMKITDYIKFAAALISLFMDEAEVKKEQSDDFVEWLVDKCCDKKEDLS